MAKLLYVANVSLDGYVEDAAGTFSWTEPGEEVFRFVTDLVRPVALALYGRRMYETMAVWEADPRLGAQSALMADFARTWQAVDKIVYSTTLHSVWTTNTSLQRRFDPEAISEMVAAANADVTIGGAELASAAFAAGLVDEVHLLTYPVVVGGGKPAIATDDRIALRLEDEQRFSDGVLYLRYSVEG
jgi:dihydrofolate reductase